MKKPIHKYLPYMYLFFFGMGFIFMMISCNPSKSIFRKTESFKSFNQRFHEDSVFQISRIRFPIKGYHETHQGREKWTKGNWIMHKMEVGEADTTKFELEITRKEDMVKEELWLEASEFHIVRKFKRIKGRWYLVSYKDSGL